MRRLLCWTAISYMTGIFLAQYISIEQLIGWGFIVLLTVIIKLIIARKIRNIMPILLSVCLLAGALYSIAYNDIHLMSISRFLNKPITFECEIIASPILKDEKVEYTVYVNKIYYKASIYDFSRKNNFIRPKIKIVSLQNEKTKIYSFGDVLKITGTLYMPPGAFNENGFDYNRYLKSKGIYAISYIFSSQIKKLDNSRSLYFIKRFTLYTRQSIIQTIDKFLPKNEAALLKGMMIGNRHEFSQKMKEDFAASGLSHLVAVSGMHVAIFLAGVMWLLSKFGINKYIIKVISIFLIIEFILVTGCTPSVVRAGIMAIIFLLSYLINRAPDPFTSLFFAALLILIYNPMVLFDVSFQLSFCATLSLLIFYQPIYSKLTFVPKVIREITTASVAAQIGTIIIAAYHFNGISTVSVIANLLVLPFASMILVSGFILYILGNINVFLGNIVAGFSYVLLKFILMISGILAKFPFALIKTSSPNFLTIIAYLLILFILYNLLKGIKNKLQLKIAFLLIIVIFSYTLLLQFWPTNDLEVTFINVGQGDCILLKSPDNKTILIDGGGSRDQSDYDIAENIVIPYLLKRGIMSIDVAIISHYHADHAEGILSMLNSLPIKTLLLPLREQNNQLKQALIEDAKRHRVPIYYLSKDDNIRVNNKIVLEVLNPDFSQITGLAPNENNQSLVLRLKYGQISFLFTGDIEREAEEYIVESGSSVAADVLKIPHHGSDTSSNESFLEAVSPRFAVISVGRNNFGHPSTQVLERLQNKKLDIYRTDVHGTITFIVDGNRIKKVKIFKEGE
ncbi:MAG: competence protein ComEC [Clostridiales bacterium]|nr:competence protein ComEC [Clostridiales bacterium]